MDTDRASPVAGRSQVGLLDPANLPVVGAEQARKLRDPRLPSNELIRTHLLHGQPVK